MQPTLESARLRLRPYRTEDAAVVQRLAGDQRVADAATTIPHPYPDGAAEAWIETHQSAFATRKEMTYAVTRLEDNLLVGTVSLIDISERHARLSEGLGLTRAPAR